MKKELPQRKHIRLKGYDYSRNGYYYVTISAEKNMPVFSRVGRGLAPAENKIILTEIGRIAEQQLFALEKRYPYVRIDKYVIMPTHIHTIIVLDSPDGAAGASPRPTLPDIICAYKSLTTRICNQVQGKAGRKIFQTSYYEEVIRNEQGYYETWQYIDENPMRWKTDYF